ncbi:anti-sigma-factor antagonist and sugar transfersase [Gloeothece citriformis PCC 7424]|uniref:Anti-sigma-factor antagonist and sugar transfersase n=1 Tax=Gloeothece citriformis (strain PCC 7424) TaxID=65393 RepID=B7KAG6_GLOC7|nr:sugar transferase [Gloeothece citriformis]ACK72940.1 anti-sigma-factor antagonist and sugar transfersase [Gloeothece citriformis PCC 7424]
MVKQFLPLTPELEVTVLNKISLVQLPVYLDFSSSLALERTCQFLFQTKWSQIILDFAQTTFIDSCGIGTLANLIKLANEKQIQIILWSVESKIQEALRAAGFESSLVIDAETQSIKRENDLFKKSQLISHHPSVNSWLKRVIDIWGALIGLSLTAILFMPIAIAIKLDSPGPILFSQMRRGWLGKPFRLWKFRSMVVNAEELKPFIENQIKGPFFKNKNDPRITKVGRFLRKSSLDELPQFWNVLKGEMSLVGTRPPTFDEVDQYTIPMWQRLNVKPGISGEWQINGRSKINNFDEVLELDLNYQKNWSIMYDVKLIFKTLSVFIDKNSGSF